MSHLVERPIRDALRMIAPGPVTLVSSMSKGQPNVMTASWVSAQSLDPTLISIAIHPGRLTHELVTNSEELIINFPVYEMMTAVHRAGTETGRSGDKFAALGLEPVDAQTLDTPRIDGCAGYIECQIEDRVSAGDHDLFIARIAYVAADDESFDGFWRIGDEAGQLLQHLGADRYATLTRPYQIKVDETDGDE